jgi:hypothetical protein
MHPNVSVDSLSANVDSHGLEKRTFADYQVWGICAPDLDRTDTHSRGTDAQDRV